MIPPWILESPLKAGIQTMEAGANTGLAIRRADATEREQAEAEERAGDLLRFHYAQLGQQDRMAQARLAQDGSAAEALRQYRGSEMLHRLAQEQHNRNNEALRNKRLDQFQAKQDATDLLTHSVNDQTGKFFGELQDGVNPASLLSKYPLASHDPSVRNLLTQSALTSRLNTRLANRATPEQQALQSGLRALYVKRAAEGPSDEIDAQIANLTQALSGQNAPETGAEESVGSAAQALLNRGEGLPQDALIGTPTTPLQTVPGLIDAPLETQARKAGQAYRTPKGVFKWTGSGWQSSE